MTTNEQWQRYPEKVRSRVEREIRRKTTLCFDVCANMGQIFGNVQHMTWFRVAIAEEIVGGMK